MRRIAIVGAGQAGLQLGFGLLADGHEVTILADRTPAETLGGRLAANHVLQHTSQLLERELGLDFWSDDMRAAGAGQPTGMHVELCPAPRTAALAMGGSWPRACALDTRMKFARWMEELERRGGTLRHQAATIEDLDDLAATHDLVCVAAGKGAISGMFQRDDERSVHDEPQRNLTLLTLRGCPPPADPDDDPIRFLLFPADGEFFHTSFLHKSGAARSFLFEARPGGALDRFGDAQTGEELLEVARALVADLSPWVSPLLADAELADELAWAKGALTPTVRKAVGVLPSGRTVLGLGDTVMLNDPIAGQGGNCAAKAAEWFRAGVRQRPAGQPFDRAWMEEQFDGFWERHGRWSAQLSNMMLAPATPAVQELLAAGAQHRAVGDEFASCFADPRRLWPWIDDLESTRARIAEIVGETAAADVPA